MLFRLKAVLKRKEYFEGRVALSDLRKWERLAKIIH